jgi:hypothetical protein
LTWFCQNKPKAQVPWCAQAGSFAFVFYKQTSYLFIGLNLIQVKAKPVLAAFPKKWPQTVPFLPVVSAVILWMYLPLPLRMVCLRTSKTSTIFVE